MPETNPTTEVAKECTVAGAPIRDVARGLAAAGVLEPS